MTTRRDMLKGGVGIAAILVAGKAPAAFVRSMIAARHGLGAPGGAAPVPLPYDAEVEYLEGTGTQYIDTLHIPTIGTRMECLASAANSANKQMGGYVSTNRFTINVASNKFAFYLGAFSSVMGPAWDDKKHLFVLDNGGGTASAKASLDDTWSHDFGVVQSVTGGNSIALFARHNNNGYQCGAWVIYSVKIYEFGILVFDFIPVRKSNVGFLYEKVSGELFGNLGPGAFLYGSDK